MGLFDSLKPLPDLPDQDLSGIVSVSEQIKDILKERDEINEKKARRRHRWIMGVAIASAIAAIASVGISISQLLQQKRTKEKQETALKTGQSQNKKDSAGN